MGLDAYVYIDHSEKRRAKLKAEIDNVDISKTLKSVESLLMAGTETSKRLAYAFDKFIEHFGDKAAGELKNVLRDTMHDEYVEVEPESIHMEEVMYFRAFWFLNKYFNYTDEWYAKDMPVTKKQIEELKSLCDRARAELMKAKIRDIYSDEELSLEELMKAKIKDTYNDKARSLLCEVFSYDEIAPCDVSKLHELCVTLLKDVDWDTERVYYNADW